MPIPRPAPTPILEVRACRFDRDALAKTISGRLARLHHAARRGRLIIEARSPETWKAMGGGRVSLLSYGLDVTALSLGPAGPVSALRETSVVFGAVIGALFLGEPLARQRISACLLVACGAMMLR